MHRLTISLEESLAEEFDAYAERHGYQNRSEAVRDLIRRTLEQERMQTPGNLHCVGAISYVYNHHERELASRLTAIQHDHHDLTVSTMHVHLSHEECMETGILRGRLATVRAFADAIIAERGVRHGMVNLVPVETERPLPGAHRHVHYRTKT